VLEQLVDLSNRLTSILHDRTDDVAARLSSGESSDGPNASATLSNTVLLLHAIAKFYGDPKAEFFPRAITTQIRDRMAQAETSLSAITNSETPPTSEIASALLRLLEDLYVTSLQYGIITFGFDGKVAQEQLEIIRRTREQVHSSARRLSSFLEEKQKESDEQLRAFIVGLENTAIDAKEEFTRRVEGTQPLATEVSTLAAGARDLSKQLAEMATLATEQTVAIKQTRTDLETLSTQIAADLNAAKMASEASGTAIQANAKQVQELASDAKTMHQDVSDSRAKIKDQMAAITEFYAEIDEYKAHLTESRKETQKNLDDLQEQAEATIDDFKTRTATVVQSNEALIGQIKDHLRKAIGASLFTAFDTRRKHIAWTSWLWAGLLIAAVGATFWYAIWFVDHLTPENDKPVELGLIYARLVIAFPLAFLVVFTAKQYARERRAEEEYAFKSAISVSLESYRDLITRMKKDGEDASLVEKLVLEIFDNPTKRLYLTQVASEREESDGLMALIDKALDKVPGGG
jgi:hypothetical protein